MGNSNLSSGRHRKCLAIHLLVQQRLLVKALLVAQRGIADARQLVGQRARGLVVIAPLLHLKCPMAHPAHRSAGLPGDSRGAQHAARPMGEQPAQVAVTTLGDVAQVAAAATGCGFGADPARPAAPPI